MHQHSQGDLNSDNHCVGDAVGLVGRYRKVYVKFWNDQRVRRLSPIPPCGQGLLIYLITNPLTTSIPGCFSAGEAGLAEMLGWDLKAFRKAFREASTEGFVEADWKARFVYLPKAFRYAFPESPNVVKSWRSAWDELPECALKLQAYRDIKGYLEGFSEGFLKAFLEACTKPSVEASANQEQEQEQEQERNKDTSNCESGDLELVPAPDGSRVLVSTRPKSADIDDVMRHYLTHFPKRAKQTRQPKHRRQVSKMLADYSVQDLCAAIDGCTVSRFHMDGGHNGLGLIFRDHEHVDKFVGYSTNPPSDSRNERQLKAVLSAPMVHEPEGTLWGDMRQKRG